jgi:RimJ/RimL family protein N-acetyltransferase
MEPTARVMFRDDRLVPYMSHLTFVARYLRPDCNDRWYVIEAEAHPIGTIALYGFSADGTEAKWGRFVVTPERRGQGWGRRALTLLVDHARELGVRRLRCEVLAGNAGAEALYRRLGFVEVGVEEAGGRRFLCLEAILDPPTSPSRGD